MKSVPPVQGIITPPFMDRRAEKGGSGAVDECGNESFLCTRLAWHRFHAPPGRTFPKHRPGEREGFFGKTKKGV